MKNRTKNKLEDLDLDTEYIPRMLDKNKVHNKKRKLNKKQWLEIHLEEQNIQIQEISQYGDTIDQQ